MKGRNSGCWCLVTLTLLFSFWQGQAWAEEETVCLQCHVAQPDALGEAVIDWRQSVHAVNGISCHDCHGGDPTDFAMAMSPERGFLGVPVGNDIPAFCGKCHLGVADIYRDSAHGRALGKGGPQCVTCHDNHRVQLASHDLINEQDCSRCHSYDRAAEIKQAVKEIDLGIIAANNDLSALKRIGIRTRPLEDKLFALRNDYHRLFHTVEIEKVRKAATDYRSRLAAITAETAAINARLDTRKVWGGAVVVLLIIAAVVLLQLKKSYDTRTSGED